MNINKTIYDGCKMALNDYGCDQVNIYNFLFINKSEQSKKELSLKIIKNILKKHRKDELHPYLVELAKIESGMKEAQPLLRDHFIHALYTFILGIFINEHLFKYNEIKVDRFEWKIASLFHDIGYPIEIANNMLAQYSDKLNKHSLNNGIEPINIIFNIGIHGLPQLNNNIISLNLIQEKFDLWNLQINANDEFNNMIQENRINHGILGSLIILYLVGILYQKYNPGKIPFYPLGDKGDWGQTYFDNQIVNACAAIFIHGLNKSRFNKYKIDFNKCPVAFLLKLSDCLQEWGRPSFDIECGLPPEYFDIKIINNKMIFYANLLDDRKDKISDELRSTLVFNNFDIEIK